MAEHAETDDKEAGGKDYTESQAIACLIGHMPEVWQSSDYHLCLVQALCDFLKEQRKRDHDLLVSLQTWNAFPS